VNLIHHGVTFRLIPRVYRYHPVLRRACVSWLGFHFTLSPRDRAPQGAL